MGKVVGVSDVVEIVVVVVVGAVVVVVVVEVDVITSGITVTNSVASSRVEEVSDSIVVVASVEVVVELEEVSVVVFPGLTLKLVLGLNLSRPS